MESNLMLVKAVVGVVCELGDANASQITSAICKDPPKEAKPHLREYVNHALDKAVVYGYLSYKDHKYSINSCRRSNRVLRDAPKTRWSRKMVCASRRQRRITHRAPKRRVAKANHGKKKHRGREVNKCKRRRRKRRISSSCSSGTERSTDSKNIAKPKKNSQTKGENKNQDKDNTKKKETGAKRPRIRPPTPYKIDCCCVRYRREVEQEEGKPPSRSDSCSTHENVAVNVESQKEDPPQEEEPVATETQETESSVPQGLTDGDEYDEDMAEDYATDQ